jgi:homoserine O-succinyltransferase
MMLTIGIVNNLPTAAIKSAERQFYEILLEAADNIPLTLRWFRLSGARPSNYETLDELWHSRFDGLIVTGAEPRAANLMDEPFWPALTKTIEWARHHTSSAIWSCLASHAAVLHLDAIRRRRSVSKIFGVFPTYPICHHPILDHIPNSWQIPHSRWNDLSIDDLEASGYQVLTTSHNAGAETFIKQFDASLFVFIQSHPEYDPAALMREYRRDIARFQIGQMMSSPELPKNYFDPQTSALLEKLRQDRAEVAHQTDLLEHARLPAHDWKPVAIQIYRNWLRYLQVSKPLVNA